MQINVFLVMKTKFFMKESATINVHMVSMQKKGNVINAIQHAVNAQDHLKKNALFVQKEIMLKEDNVFHALIRVEHVPEKKNIVNHA